MTLDRAAPYAAPPQVPGRAELAVTVPLRDLERSTSMAAAELEHQAPSALHTSPW